MNKTILRNRIRDCLNQQQQDIDRKANALKQRNNRSAKFYSNGRWAHLREYVMSKHPICYNCRKYGIITPATEVHHCIPFLTGKDDAEKWSLFLDISNLVPLCEHCHKEIHRLMRANHRIIDIRDTMDVLPEKIADRLIEQTEE